MLMLQTLERASSYGTVAHLNETSISQGEIKHCNTAHTTNVFSTWSKITKAHLASSLSDSFLLASTLSRGFGGGTGGIPPLS